MPAKGSFSHIIEPNKFVDPMDLNVLLKGTMYKEDIAKNNLQDLQSSYQQLASIPAYGEDAKILQGKLEELKNNVSQMKLGNLSDYNTSAQIKGVVNNFASDPVLNDIAQRWTPYEKELKKKEEAEAKGNIYLSPIIDNGNKYIQKGEYIQGKNLGGSGWIGANYQKLKKEALENVQKVKKYTTKNGMVHETESYDEDALKQTITALYNDPRIKRDLEFNLSKSLEEQDSNFTEYGRNFVKNQILTAYQAMQLNPNDSKAQEYIDSYSDLLENDVSLEEIGRTQMIQEEIDKNIQNDIKTSQFISEGRPKIDDIYSKNLDFNHKLQEELFKQQAALFEGLSNDDQQKVIAQGNFNGINLENAAKKIQENKAKNAAAANPANEESKRLENLSLYIGEGTYTEREFKIAEQRAKQHIEYFKELGYKNIQGVDEIKDNGDGTVTIDFDRVSSIDNITTSTGIKGYKWGEYRDEITITKEEFAKILKKGETVTKTGSEKPKEENYINYGEIDLGGGKTVKAKILTSESDTSNLKKGEYAIVNGMPFQKD